MREFELIPAPVGVPWGCFVCQSATGPLVDTQTEHQAIGRIYLCKLCARRAARLYGFAPGKKLDELADASTSLGLKQAEVDNLQHELEEVRLLNGSERATVKDLTWRSYMCYGPHDLKTKWSKLDTTGRELGVETEFADHGITFISAQQDRRAGYQRVSEMLRRVPGRRFPDWHPLRGTYGPLNDGAPRLFILDTETLKPLVEQLRNAPLEDLESNSSRFPGEAVDQKWESAHGHAHAMLRYGLMSRPGPSVMQETPPEDPRAKLLWEHERRVAGAPGKRNYQW